MICILLKYIFCLYLTYSVLPLASWTYGTFIYHFLLISSDSSFPGLINFTHKVVHVNSQLSLLGGPCVYLWSDLSVHLPHFQYCVLWTSCFGFFILPALSFHLCQFAQNYVGPPPRTPVVRPKTSLRTLSWSNCRVHLISFCCLDDNYLFCLTSNMLKVIVSHSLFS